MGRSLVEADPASDQNRPGPAQSGPGSVDSGPAGILQDLARRRPTPAARSPRSRAKTSAGSRPTSGDFDRLCPESGNLRSTSQEGSRPRSGAQMTQFLSWPAVRARLARGFGQKWPELHAPARRIVAKSGVSGHGLGRPSTPPMWRDETSLAIALPSLRNPMLVTTVFIPRHRTKLIEVARPHSAQHWSILPKFGRCRPHSVEMDEGHLRLHIERYPCRTAAVSKLLALHLEGLRRTPTRHGVPIVVSIMGRCGKPVESGRSGPEAVSNTRCLRTSNTP